jgi:DNA-binding transcriptional MerR regulator
MNHSKTPDKLFYRLDEVCRLTKVDKDTLEAWEKEFPFLQAGLAGDGQKIFRTKDIEIIRRMKQLLDERSVTLAGARRKIEAEFGLKPTQSVHPDKMLKTLWQVRDELQELAQTLGPRPKKS